MTAADPEVSEILCDDLARRKRIVFAGPSIIGVFSFTFHKIVENSPDVYYFSWSDTIIKYLDLFDRMTLIRSNLELRVIFDKKGLNYYEVATVMEAASSVISIIAVLYSLRESKAGRWEKRITSSSKKVFAAAAISAGALLFRPIDIYSNSVFLNHADNFGFYFIREGVLISFGYYNLYFLVLNLWVSYCGR